LGLPEEEDQESLENLSIQPVKNWMGQVKFWGVIPLRSGVKTRSVLQAYIPESIMKKKLAATPSSIQTDSLGLERIIFFSDAVFAIAVTLLALEIRLPDSNVILSEEQLRDQILGMWQTYLGYFISFMVIGIFWMAHHRKFRLIRAYDSRLMLLNLLLLLVVAFLPFPSSLLSKYPDPVATNFYALIMIVGEMLLCILWWYASRNNRLTDPKLDPRQRRRQIINPIATSLVFLLSMGIAYLSPALARLSWILILPVTMYANREK
jgi:uncharacterized membrane protein